MIKLETKKRRRNIDTKKLILDSAEKLIAREGLDAFRLRDIAEPLGIRVPSIYSHFAGREAVCAGVAQRYIEQLAKNFPYDESDPTITPTEAILAGVRGVVLFHANHPAFTRIKLRDMEMPGGLPDLNVAAGGTPDKSLRQGPISIFYARIQKILDRGQELGEFRTIDVVHFMRTVLGTALLSLTWPTQAPLSEDAPPEEIERIVDEIEDLARMLLGIEPGTGRGPG